MSVPSAAAPLRYFQADESKLASRCTDHTACALLLPLVFVLLLQRPFYFHTDESKLASLFSAVSNAGIKPKPVVFPAV
jgi:hypothetical protein